MSTCISLKGEFSKHVYDGETLGSRFNCARCYAFDEDAADAAIRRVEALAEWWESAGTVSVYESAVELAQMLREAIAGADLTAPSPAALDRTGASE